MKSLPKSRQRWWKCCVALVWQQGLLWWVGGTCSSCPGSCSPGRGEVTLMATLHVSIPCSHSCAGIQRGTGRDWGWECAVPCANVGVGVRAMGIPYSQTMICGMKARVFQLKIKMSAWWINLLHQESSDPANCFCRIDCFENIKKHPKASKQANKQAKKEKHHHLPKNPK